MSEQNGYALGIEDRTTIAFALVNRGCAEDFARGRFVRVLVRFLHLESRAFRIARVTTVEQTLDSSILIAPGVIAFFDDCRSFAADCEIVPDGWERGSVQSDPFGFIGEVL